VSRSNILVDPAMYRITGIIDWESIGIRPGWEERYPEFLQGDHAKVKPELPSEDVKVRLKREQGN
jgi:hypothetical protein